MLPKVQNKNFNTLAPLWNPVPFRYVVHCTHTHSSSLTHSLLALLLRVVEGSKKHLDSDRFHLRSVRVPEEAVPAVTERDRKSSVPLFTRTKLHQKSRLISFFPTPTDHHQHLLAMFVCTIFIRDNNFHSKKTSTLKALLHVVARPSVPCVPSLHFVFFFHRYYSRSLAPSSHLGGRSLTR